MCEVKEYLEMHVDFINIYVDTISLNQKLYYSIGQEIQYGGCRNNKTPFEVKLEKIDLNRSQLPYQNLIGGLMHLAVLERRNDNLDTEGFVDADN